MLEANCAKVGEGNTIKEQLRHYRNGNQLEFCVNACTKDPMKSHAVGDSVFLNMCPQGMGTTKHDWRSGCVKDRHRLCRCCLSADPGGSAGSAKISWLFID